MEWDKEFNKLPDNIRRIGCAQSCITRINQMKTDKKRIKNAYKKAIKEINDHIKTCEIHLKTLEKENIIWGNNDH